MISIKSFKQFKNKLQCKNLKKKITMQKPKKKHSPLGMHKSFKFIPVQFTWLLRSVSPSALLIQISQSSQSSALHPSHSPHLKWRGGSNRNSLSGFFPHLLFLFTPSLVGVFLVDEPRGWTGILFLHCLDTHRAITSGLSEIITSKVFS